MNDCAACWTSYLWWGTTNIWGSTASPTSARVWGEGARDDHRRAQLEAPSSYFYVKPFKSNGESPRRFLYVNRGERAIVCSETGLVLLMVV